MKTDHLELFISAKRTTQKSIKLRTISRNFQDGKSISQKSYKLDFGFLEDPFVLFNE